MTRLPRGERTRLNLTKPIAPCTLHPAPCTKYQVPSTKYLEPGTLEPLRVQRLLNIRDDVFDMLDPDAQSNHVGGDAGGDKLFL